tara:strand:- start:2015 stop:2299 length:285 start_codon:yes stop_codon:yes gene_type:complete
MIFGYLNRKRIKKIEERLDLNDEFNRATLKDLKAIRNKIVEIEEFYSTDFVDLENRFKKNVSSELKSYLSQTNKELDKKIKQLSRFLQNNNPIY